MASSSSDRLNHIPQEFKDLFSWNPPRLRSTPIHGHETSTKTREPAFFDRHFTDKLKVLHVKRLPSLVHDIADLVDKTIAVSPYSVFSPSPAWFSAAEINRSLRRVPGMVDEKAVACFYDNTTAKFCEPVASTLALGHPDLLKWSQSSNVSGYPIADGYLSLFDPSELAEKGVQFEKDMDEQTLKLFRRLIAAETPVSLLTHQFKNMAAGCPETMLAIPNLSNQSKFNWTNCESLDFLESRRHQKERDKVAAVQVGPDAEVTTRTFGLHDGEHHSLEEMGGRKAMKRKRSDGTSSQGKADPPVPSEASTVPEMLPPPTGRTRGRQLTSSTKPQPPPRTTRQSAKRQKQLALPPIDPILETPQSSGRILPPPLPLRSQAEAAVLTETGKEKSVVEGKEKAQGGYNDETNDGELDDEGGDGEPNDEFIDPSFKDKYDLSAQFIVQQAWAQATRVDCSILVLNSGNHEFICIRHRRTQTLYVSEFIEPSVCKEPSYGKLHVGLYLAAVKDTMDRERQKCNALIGGGDGPSCSGGGNADSARGSGRGGRHNGDRRDPHSGREPGKGGQGTQPKRSGSGKKPKESGTGRGRSVRSTFKKMAMAAHEFAAQKTFDIAGRRDIILLFLQYGIYDSSNPSTFIRSLPTGQAPNPLPSRETVRSYKLKECLTIVLKSEIGHGATGEVLRGTLEVEESEGCVLLDVAVKLALSSEQRAALMNEYATYHQLRLKGVTSRIIAPLGLFYDVHPEGGPSALVMPYAGVPLDEMPELILPYSHREAILASLKEIHRADILHGDLCPRNILVADSGLTIIDFSHSRVCDDQVAKNREYLQLQSLLDDVQSRMDIHGRN